MPSAGAGAGARALRQQRAGQNARGSFSSVRLIPEARILSHSPADAASFSPQPAINRTAAASRQHCGDVAGDDDSFDFRHRFPNIPLLIAFYFNEFATAHAHPVPAYPLPLQGLETEPPLKGEARS